MGISEKCSLPFVQEVVAATNYVRREHPHTATMIDIGGEDAKVVFFQDGQATDLRMNGNCAGGTGAFIDQMAILLGVSINELNELALRSNPGILYRFTLRSILQNGHTESDSQKYIQRKYSSFHFSMQ